MVRSSTEHDDAAAGDDTRPSAREAASPAAGGAFAAAGDEPARAPGDAVLEALADAIRAAAAAGRFDAVMQLTRELEARRLAARSENVLHLDPRRRRPPPRG